MFPPFRESEHERLRELSSPYVDGRLSHEEKAWVEKHLEGCQECREELDSLRSMVAVLQQVPIVPAPRSFALAQAPQRERWEPQRPLVWAMQLSTGVAALLLGLIVIGDFLQGTSPPPAPASQMQSLAQEKAAVPPPAAAPRAMAVPAAPVPAPAQAGAPAAADSGVPGAEVATPSPAPAQEKVLGPQAAPEPSQPKGTGTQGLGALRVLEVILGTLVLVLGGVTGYLMLRARGKG